MKCSNTIMNQRHLLECKYISGKNEIHSYIPRYEDLFTGELEEQIYISRLLKENLIRLKAQQTMSTGYLLHVLLFHINCNSYGSTIKNLKKSNPFFKLFI